MIATFIIVVVVESRKMLIYKYLKLVETRQHRLLLFLRPKHLMQFLILAMGQYDRAEGDTNDDNDYADYDVDSDDDDDQCTNKSYCWLRMEYS